MRVQSLSHRWHAIPVITFCVLLVSTLLLALNFAPTQAQPPTSPVAPVVASTEPYIEYAPNTLLLKLRPGVTLTSGQVNAAGVAVTSSADSLNQLLAALGATTAKPVFAGDGVTAAQAGDGRAGLERIHRIQWTSTIPVAHAVAALAADPAVEYAEPDYIARAVRTPNDPEYAAQWALPRINAPAAWDVTTGAADVVIAIIDSGVDTAHTDFAGRLWVNDDPVNGADDDLNGKVDDTNGWNVLTENGNLSDPSGHGTQVGGVAGAATDNGAGVAGMCWGCKLMFVNAMQASGAANYSHVAAAVQYAASNGAHVINLSLGGYADSAMLRDAIREAATTAVIVAGAGNDDSSTLFYPAAYPEVLAVAATDSNDQKAIFSNYGAWVDVSAPGKDIRTTTVSGYATDSGTSLAAPFVAGLTGLIKSQHPAWTAEQVKWQVLNTAIDIDALNPTRAGQLGEGRIDAGAALTTDPQPRAAVESYAIDGQANARPAPGQAFQLVLNVRNLWLLGQNLQGTLASSDPYVSISDGDGAFGDIAPGQLGSNSGGPFAVAVSGGAPYNHALQFTLNLSGAGGYSLAVPLTIQVRSSVETLGNTIYSVDTTWTNDKNYVLNGTVIVNQGVTLTIQPGTVIKANPGKFIRVDGALIARGTAEQPILFTTNSITNATWSGIRFADTAIDASYDAAGAYVAGSVLQHVTISYADIAASLSTRSPYIADSTFRNNGTSIQVGNNNNGGAPHIERNEFSGGGGNAMMPGSGGGAITLNGGQPLIRQNTITGAASGISGSGNPTISTNAIHNSGSAISLSGSPTIIGNVIQNNTGVGITTGGTPVVRDNVIVGNGGGISASGLQLVEVEHNLIANNGGVCAMPPCGSSAAAVALDVQSSGFSQISPSIAYNPTQDEYLAVWVESTTSGVVKVRRLAGDGQPAGGENTVSGQATMTGISFAHAVYQSTQDRYLVVWAGMDGVKGRFVTAAGLTSGDVLPIFTTRDATAVRVSYLPVVDTFLIAYQAYVDCCSQKVHIQRLTAAGSLIGDVVIIGNDVSSHVYLGDIALDPSNNKAFVTFHSDSWQNRIWGAWIEPATQVVSSTIVAENPGGYPNRRPSVAFGSSANRFEVVWEQWRGWQDWSDPRSLSVQPVAADGMIPVSPTVIFSDTGQVTSPRIVFGATPSEFLAVWVYGAASATPAFHTLHAHRIDSNGVLVSSPILISAPASRANGIRMNIPAIAYNSQRNEYLVAWADDRIGTNSIWAQRLSATGQLLDNAWTPVDETNPANNFRISQWRGVRYNTIIYNTGYGIQLGGPAAAAVNIANNNLFGNGTYDLYLTGGQAGTQNFTVVATDNFWNIDASQIPNRIRDCTFDDNGCGTASSTVGQVTYNPPLAAPDQTAPAYVRSVTMNPNPVGLQRGVVTVDFSKPMSMTALPAASFHDARRGTTQQMLSDTVQMMTKDTFGRVWSTVQITPYAYPNLLKMYDGQKWQTYDLGVTTNNPSASAIFAADNGDIWIGHGTGGGLELPVASQLRGGTWMTYTATSNTPVNPIHSIGQDFAGALWFGTSSGVSTFDGSTWRLYTVSDGLISNYVQRIVRDAQGRMWFMTMEGLSAYDGVTWTKHNASTGMPANPWQILYADSQGRVWAGLSTGAIIVPNRPYLAMHDGASWHYFGSTETNGRLTCDVNGIAESPDGVLWFRACGNAITYDGASWSTASYGSGYTTAFVFDRRGNLWYGDSMGSGTFVRWGGLDHPFTDGQWLSPTRFQAGYNFDANVLPGFYAVQSDGAIGGDGMAAYAGSDATFQVDFGSGVTTDPPAPPQVAAQTTGSLNHLTASWQANSPNIDQYRYAIGTTPGARDVVGWTYLAGTNFTRTDLNLTQGQRYYVTVQARNTSGLWSVDGVSNVVIGGQVVTPPTPTPPLGGASNLYLPAVQR